MQKKTNTMKEKNRRSLSKLVDQYEHQLETGEQIHLDEQSFLKLIDYYDENGQIDKALFVVGQAIEKYLFSVDFYLRKAELLLDLGDETEALDVLEQANTFAPGSIEINLLKAEALNYLDERDAALQILNDSKSNVPKSILSEIFLMESLVYEHHADLDAMFDVLEQAVVNNPKNNEAVERLGLAMELTERYREGIKINEVIIDQHPYSHLAWYNLGNAYRALDKTEEAIDAYKYAIAIDERFEYAYHACAAIYFLDEKHEQALEYFKDLLKIVHPSERGEIHLKIGSCYHLTNRNQLAKKHLLIAQKTSFYQDTVYFLLGSCALMDGTPKEAGYYFEKAVSINPDNGAYHANLAKVRIQEEAYDEAVSHYKKAIDLHPDSTDIWADYILFYFDLGYEDKAFQLLDSATHYLGEVIAGYIRVALLYLAGKRNKGSILLWELLMEDYEAHDVIFRIAPELEEDSEINAIIAVI